MTHLTRRSALHAGAALALAGTAGCIGFLTGNESLAFEADPAAVEDATVTETGYEQTQREPQTVNREFNVAGQTRSVEVTNWITTYEKAVSIPAFGDLRAALFVAFTTPQINIAGQTLNPVGDLSNRDLLAELQSRYEGLSIGDRVGSRSLSVLGSSVTVDQFEGAATVEGTEVDINVYVTRFKHEDDFVVAIGGHPARLPDEQGDVYAMMQGLVHPVETA